MGQDVSVPVGDATMEIYVAHPDATPRGAIVVVQEAFGVNDHIRDLCHRLAGAGYVAAAPHLYHRSGDPEYGYDDPREVMPNIMQLQAEEIEADLEATFAHLKDLGFEGRRVGILGFCMGGTIATIAGCSWELGAAVSFYGAGIAQSRFGFPPLFDIAPTMRSPFLGLFGDQDASIPVNEVEGLREALGKAGVETEVVRYPDADHGFNCDARSSYHEASATDAWGRALAWFDAHLA